MVPSEKLAECYEQLNLPVDADLKSVDEAYFQIRGQMICAGQRQAIAPLKTAYHTIKQHLLTTSNRSDGDGSEKQTQKIDKESVQQTQTNYTKASPANNLSAALAERGLSAKLSIRQRILHVGVAIRSDDNKNDITHKVYETLSQANLVEWGLENVEIVRVYGLIDRKQTAWKQAFPMPNLQMTADDSDLYSFNNRISNTFIFPGILLFAALLNSIEGIRLLLFGIVIWLHEFGHATVAWLCGYRAIPLPFGWTNTGLEKSLFVYFGILILLGLLFWTGRKEKRKWPVALAIALAIVQLWGTWLISDETYDLLISFGGVGGEFYLSTLLIVSFYFPLPQQWRWDFYRYPTLLGAGFVLIGSAWRWQQIESGTQAIPWGSLLGGSGDMGGDMNRLIEHGWSDQQIIDVYNSLGSVCIVVIVSIYFYFFLKQRNHLFLYAKWRRWKEAASH